MACFSLVLPFDEDRYKHSPITEMFVPLRVEMTDFASFD